MGEYLACVEAWVWFPAPQKKKKSHQVQSKNEKLGLASMAIKCCKELMVYKMRLSAVLSRPNLFHSAVLMRGNFSAGGARQVGGAGSYSTTWRGCRDWGGDSRTLKGSGSEGTTGLEPGDWGRKQGAWCLGCSAVCASSARAGERPHTCDTGAVALPSDAKALVHKLHWLKMLLPFSFWSTIQRGLQFLTQ